MSPETNLPEPHRASPRDKIIRMANQIGTFFASKPHDEGVAGIAEHLNKFWEPRMRQHFFDVVDGGGAGLIPLVLDAQSMVRRPGTAAPSISASVEAGAPGGKGSAAGESKAEIAESQG